MESAKQERKNLMNDMPVDRVASGGSWMSKHSQSRIGGSPMMMKEKGGMMMKEKEGMMMKEEMKDSPAKMKSPAELTAEGKKKIMASDANPAFKAAIAKESPTKMYGGKKGDDSKSKKDYESPAKMYGGKKGDDSKSKKDYM